jgi:hypothetical protein
VITMNLSKYCALLQSKYLDDLCNDDCLLCACLIYLWLENNCASNTNTYQKWSSFFREPAQWSGPRNFKKPGLLSSSVDLFSISSYKLHLQRNLSIFFTRYSTNFDLCFCKSAPCSISKCLVRFCYPFSRASTVMSINHLPSTTHSVFTFL